MYRTAPSRRRASTLAAIALSLTSGACTDDSSGPESPIIQQFIEAASAGSTNGAPRPGSPPSPGGGGGILGEFLNRATPGGTSQVTVRASGAIGRLIIAIQNALNYYEIIPPTPFPAVADAGAPHAAATMAAGTGSADVVVSIRFAAAPPNPVFTLRIAASSTADGPIGEYLSLPIDLSETTDPRIGLTPASATLTAAQGSAPPPSTKIAVENSGTGTLDRLSLGTITFTPSSTAWATVSLQGTVAPTSLTITATTTNLSPGTYNATVPVRSPAAQETPRNLAVSYVITQPPPPSIALSSDSIAFLATMRGTNPAPQTVNITNGGGGTLTGLSLGRIDFTPATNTAWLSATLRGTTAPTSVELRASVFNLVRGTYTATVPVRSSIPNVEQRIIRVRFRVDE